MSISIHAPLTGSDWFCIGGFLQKAISIHAPLTGSDISTGQNFVLRQISIHAPLTGSDRETGSIITRLWIFQSTLPLRGATHQLSCQCNRKIISIHAPLTGSDDGAVVVAALAADFNPRSPYGERHFPSATRRSKQLFQSTLPLRGATTAAGALPSHTSISIHAPLTGSDPRFAVTWPTKQYFNPRSPYGERLVSIVTVAPSYHFNPRSPYGERRSIPRTVSAKSKFQSTLPLRGATIWCRRCTARIFISIHAPLTGSDTLNPNINSGYDISIHAPLTGSDLPLMCLSTVRRMISIHAPLTGSDVSPRLKRRRGIYFNPRSPYGERRTTA